MNKLEIALEKSRKQRATTMNLSPVEGDVSFAGRKMRTAAAPPRPAGHTAIDEKLLIRNRIVAFRTRSPEADVYRQLRTHVLQIMNKANHRTLAITSPHYGDGKSTVAINLGISIALDIKQTVLLADLDLRKPNMHQYLGLTPQAGLTDYLLNGTPLEECMVRPPFERLNVLPAGPVAEHSSELIGSPKMIALAEELKTRYPDRFVIYDMPPVLSQDDPIAFLPHIDAVLVVIRDGITRIHDVERCLNILSGANVIGTVLNACR